MKSAVPFALAALLTLAPGPVAALTLQPQDRVCVIGNTFGERLQFSNYFETLLHARFASQEIVMRNLSWATDTLTLQPRPQDCPTQDDFLKQYQASVIIACFGMNESFETPVVQFRQDLEAFIARTKAANYDGKSPPRLVILSPIAHEDTGRANLPNAQPRNEILATYVAVMTEVCQQQQVEFVDLFVPFKTLYNSNPALKLTSNGIHLNDAGEKAAANFIDSALFGSAEAIKKSWAPEKLALLRSAVAEKNQQFWYRHRPVNPFYIYGGRAAPFGTISFPSEMAKLDAMVANRDRKVWDIAAGKSNDLTIDDSNTPVIVRTETNFPGDPEILSPADEQKTFTIAEGFEVNLFASEVEFPEMADPVQLTFDAKGRMWVSTIPTYPHALPGVPPDDKILIFEDNDKDGKADKCTTFADKLYLPIGLELGYGGVFTSGEPSLLFLKDTNGDDKADINTPILHGFGTEDSHHAISAFCWGPGGGLHMMEGTFHHTQVETPHGPTRLVNAGILRYEPNTEKLSAYVSYGYANPWGQTWDRWGRNYVADASGGDNHYGNAYSGYLPYPEKHANMERFTPKEGHIRPTSGCEVVSSQHFPDEYQQWWLLNNCIGFQGTRMFKIEDEGSGFKATKWIDLISSSHRNFRPCDLEFGPDGALYIVDWYSPLVGHMQHSLRDPKRDRTHGRIWRITAKNRPLVPPVKIDGAREADLLAGLRTYEDRARYRIRRELAQRDTPRVLLSIEQFLKSLPPNDPAKEHLQLECLWVQQHHNAIQGDLLQTVLASEEPRARAAAVYALRFCQERFPDSAKWLFKAAADPSPVVRLEAVVAASFRKDIAAVEIALTAINHPQDYYIEYALKETMRAIEPIWKKAVAAGTPFSQDNPAGQAWLLSRFTNAEVLAMPKSPQVNAEILRREGMGVDQLKAAVADLGKTSKSPVAAMLAALPQAKGTALASLLANWDPVVLASEAPAITKLAQSASGDDLRDAAYAALTASDGGRAAWGLAKESPTGLMSMLRGLRLINDPAVRDQLQPVLASLLTKLPEPLAAKLAENKTAAARFLRIELPRKGTLSLTEVEVFSSGENIARSGTATQSSTSNDAPASRAIDGGTHGEFGRGTTTHTNEDETNPWWELDLGSSQPIENVRIHNRVDGSLGLRLEGFKLSLLDASRQPVFVSENNQAPAKIQLPIATNPLAGLRGALVRAYASLPGRTAEKFQTFLPMLGESDSRAAAITALKALDPGEADPAGLAAAAKQLQTLLPAVPMQERTEAWFADSLTLARSIAAKVPALAGLAAIADKEAPHPLTVKSVKANLFYDVKLLTAAPGQVIALTFENVGEMPHNLVLAAPGSLEKVGNAADAMQTDPGAMAKGWVPALPQVLQQTKLLQPEEKQTLVFRLPDTAGDYPYLCTFPGHWRIMQGVLRVK
jgi:glucose/arabinose dehydrogenase/azurin